MTYPSEFYYTESQSSLSYSDSPSGVLDVGHLTRGQPYWIIPSAPHVPKPKKLILADWSACAWSTEKIEKVKEYLGKLLDEGFELYLWQHGEVISLPREKLSCLDEYDVHNAIGLAYTQEIIQAAVAQHHMTHDHIQVLDDYWIRRALGNSIDGGRRVLLSSDLDPMMRSRDATESPWLKKVIDVLSKSTPKLEAIIHNAFIWRVNRIINNLRSFIPTSMPIIPMYQFIELTGKQVVNLVRTGTISSGGALLTNCKEVDALTIDEAQLGEPIDEAHHVTAELLEQLLKCKEESGIGLKKLYLDSSIIFLDAISQVTFFGLSTLELLNLSDSDIMFSALEKYLKVAPNLSSLDVTDCNITIDECSLAPNSLPKLLSLDLMRTRISSKNLKKVLEAAVNLKKLYLIQGMDNLEEMLSEEVLTKQFTQLEVFSLSCHRISSSLLGFFLKDALGLRKLYLSSCTGSLEEDLSAIKGLLMLKSLDLTRCTLSSDSIKRLLSVTSKLKVLSLASIKCNLNGIFSVNKLAYLESINLSKSRVTCTELNFLSSVAPNIKSLDLSHCINLSNSPDTFAPGSFYSLQTLNLSYSSISSNILKMFLRAAPNLKNLDLGYITHMDIDLELEDLLFQVEQVTLFEKKYIKKSSAGTPVDPRHKASEMKNFKPTPENKPFVFCGANKTKNQGMIVEKLSQYLTLSAQHLEVIPKLQDGICMALAHYFIEKFQNWDSFIEQVSAWNGQKESLDSCLHQFFDSLYEYVVRYQLQGNGDPSYYLGDNLALFLNSCTAGVFCILKNPWHAMVVQKLHEKDLWTVYDPNFVNGARIVKHNELIKTLHTTLGSLVCVESKDSRLVPKIGNALIFIEQGGLLALCQNTNVSEMMRELMPVVEYSTEALEGLFMRDVHGKPVWVNAMKSPKLSTYTLALLEQFTTKNPGNYMQRLQQSMECLTPQQKSECIQNLIQKCVPSLAKESGVIPDKLVEVIRTLFISSEYYDRSLQTWVSSTPALDTLLKYCQHCLDRNDMKKRLIKLSHTADVDALQYVLQKSAQEMHRPVFYINSPDELVCLAPYVAHQKKGKGLLRRGPGGPLHDFLEANRAKTWPVLIVNYDQFKSEDIVRCNSLLDPEGRADGTLVPENALVIGLINVNKPGCYQGSDFYSRFDCIESCPLSQKLLASALPELPVRQKEESMPAAGSVINLYNASDWEQRLIGCWTLEGRDLIFQEGALAKAIVDAKEGFIEIQNAPWEKPEFQRFWRQAVLTKYVDNGRISIPDTIQLIRSEGYPWDEWNHSLRLEPGLFEDALVLNPNRLGEFFGRYECNAGTLTCRDGFIKAAAGKKLHVNLTRSLSEDGWAMVLAACKEHKVTLVAHCAPGIELPKVLGASLVLESLVSVVWNKTALGKTAVVLSTDIDTSVAQCNAADDWIVIDVSECAPSDILHRIDGVLIKGPTPYFTFKDYPSVLIQTLEQGKKIILKGHFSSELVDELAPLVLARQSKSELSGSLVLVTQDGAPFNYIAQHTHSVTVDEKAALLRNVPLALEPFMAKESLSQLKARQAFLQAHPEAKSSDDAWAGLEHLSGGLSNLGALDVGTSEQETREFTEKRLSAVRALLDRDQYVFLTGLSGVGKSTFVTQELCQTGDTLYSGDKNIEAWARDSNISGRKLLFLDEVNLSSREWSEFEGLFHKPPTLLIRGVLHTLSQFHQVIFAGNPLSYGDERKLAPLFKRHGNAVVFSPLTPAVIYEKSLKPVFEGTNLEKSAPEICKHILNVYEFLCKRSTNDVLISPRELQMMALLVRAAHQENPKENPLALSKYYAYQLSAALLAPARFKEDRADFDTEFKPEKPLLRDNSPEMSHFKLTPSRHGVKQYLDDFLALREMRRSNSIKENEAQQYGGLGGLILEGPPGVGKSELVIAALRARGYTKVRTTQKQEKPANRFYLMPVSMPLNEKETLLRQAFHEGAVVVIDEINSSPMMERLLNDLLMGKTPENERPKYPGFMVIGTQNPVSMAGRRAPSTALARRLTTVELPDYPVKEIQTILETMCLPVHQAYAMALAFKKQVDYARDNHLSPAPTFRDLLKLAKTELVGHVLVLPKFITKMDCLILLEEIKSTGFGAQDTEMEHFVAKKMEQIESADDKTIHYLSKELEGLRDNLCSVSLNKTTQVEALKAVIGQFRKRANSIFSVGMRDKAKLIETAIRSISVEERVDIMNGDSTSAVREALASHRHWDKKGKVYKTGNDIDEQYAARTYSKMRQLFPSDPSKKGPKS